MPRCRYSGSSWSSGGPRDATSAVLPGQFIHLSALLAPSGECRGNWSAAGFIETAVLATGGVSAETFDLRGRDRASVSRLRSHLVFPAPDCAAWEQTQCRGPLE